MGALFLSEVMGVAPCVLCWFQRAFMFPLALVLAAGLVLMDSKVVWPPVHIVEFFDPPCETCAKFYPPVKQMMAANREDIRLTVRYAPFHQGSDEVVKVLEASRKQSKYWQAFEALVASQSAWAKGHQANVDLVWPYLATAGLDIDRLKSDMQTPDIARAIAQDVMDGKTLNVSKTPEFFVNGRPLPSFGFDQLRTLVDEELAAARKGKAG